MRTPMKARTLNAPGWLVALAALVGLAGPATAAELNDKCIVSVLNRTAYVQADGSWVLPNTPANIGRVRVRATCVEGGVTRSGQSDYFQVPLNGVIRVPEIRFDVPQPIPSRLVVGAPQTTLEAIGATLQLAVTAQYPDGSTADVTGSVKGTNYTSTNPAIASVTPEGLVTAQASGVALLMALNDGASGLLRVQVVLSGDTDGDGIPDDIELANGLNPNDPVDALEDYDADGLTNRQELELGTQIRNADTDGDTLPDGREVDLGTDPLLFDTDGDGLSDGLEVSTGSDPLDPSSYNLAQALSFIEVRPTAVALVVNTLIGEASRQLTVTGRLIDGTTLNLTSRSRGTNYASSNLSIVSFGLVDGQIFAGADGNATVTVSNAGFTAAVPANVRSFSPRALSFVSIPGFANNVDVAGPYAYVAAGSTGLQIVDVSNRAQPFVAASLDTTGNANDVVVSGAYAYVADGTAGLRVIDVSNPLAPALRATFDTPGVAWDVVARGGRAYVADGAAGLRIVDVSDPSNPLGLGFFDTAGTAKGVDVQGTLAVVADGSALRVIDVTDPAAPVLRGSLGMVDARDVALDDNVAYVADYTGSLKVVSVANPAAPALIGSTSGTLGGYLTDVVKLRNFTFASDVFFVNGVPITDVSVPQSPQVRARLDFPARDDNGTGIAADNSYVYLTAERGITENGASGDTRLYIGQYLEVTDDAGVAPTVAFTAPAPDAQPIAGTSLTLRATASDDVAVASVTFALDGAPVATDFAAPYEATLTLPTTAGPVTFTATALDFGGNVGTAERTIVVQPDPPPVVTLTAPTVGQTVYEGATVTLAATASDNGAVARVRFLVNGVQVALDTTAPYSTSYAVPLGASSLEVTAEATDNLGQTSSDTRTVPITSDPPPVVDITAPAPGQSVVEGATVSFSATAVDNVQVTLVRFFVDGALLATDTTAPYTTSFTAPLDATSVELSVQATDNLGRATTVVRTVAVTPDPPPVVDITSPAAGQSVVEGTTLTLSADASDNVQVTQVRFLADGVLVAVDNGAPYAVTYTVALGATSLTVAAEASDNLGRSTTATRTVTVTADPRTTVVGTVVDQSGQPVAGATVRAFAEWSGQTAADGTFSLPGVVTARGDITVSAEAMIGGRRYVGASSPAGPVPGGTTAVGTITLQALSFETEIGDLIDPSLFGNLDDGSAQIALPFPFSFYGETYTDVYVGTNGYVTFGAPDTNYGNDLDTFAQLAPRIAPKFRDWVTDQDPDGAGVYVNTALPDRVVVTWKNMRRYGGGGPALSTPGKPLPAHATALATPTSVTPEASTATPPAASAPATRPDLAAVAAGATFATAPPLFPEAPSALPEAASAAPAPAAAAAHAPDARLAGPPTSTFQVVLYADGRVQIGYDGAFVRDAVVGLTPGGAGGGGPDAGGFPANLQPYDFSTSPAIAVDSNTAPFEQFLGFPDSPFDLDHTFLVFDPDGLGGYTGTVQAPVPAPPTVAITSPVVGDLLIEGQTIVVTADASDDVLVTQVVFTVDGNVYAPLSEPPYEVFHDLPVGATGVTIQVSATDNQGLTASANATLPVSPDPPPAVALSGPAPGTQLVEGETVTLVADATDNVAVARVDFAAQGLALPADTLAPYARTFRVPSAVTGLNVSASATDNLGRSASAAASFTVGPDPLTTVRGTVTDHLGNPVAGATVNLLLHGLRGEFFHFDAPLATFPDLTGLTPDAVRTVSSLDFRNPGNLFNNDTFGVGLGPNFAARFTATLNVTAAGSHVFTLGANDGARLLIDGTPLVETVGGSYAEVSGVRSLTAGAHALEVLYFQNDGDAELQLAWTRPGEERDTVPATAYAQPALVATTPTDAAGAFSFAGVPSALGGVRVTVTAVVEGETRQGQSSEVAPVRGGVTDLGAVQLRGGVLIVAADSSPPTTQLTATGLFSRVDFFNATSATPTLAALAAYPVVLVYTNFTPANATALGNVLADYVDGGGAVVLTTYSFSTPWSVQGRITTYSPLTNVGQNGNVGAPLTAVVPGDAMFTGINLGAVTYFRNSNFSRPGLAADGVLLATDPSGIRMIARSATRRVVALNLFPGTGVSGNNAECYRLIANALATAR
jgi:protocatechuate 3,4-dioxygenase beta subunit